VRDGSNIVIIMTDQQRADVYARQGVPTRRRAHACPVDIMPTLCDTLVDPEKDGLADPFVAFDRSAVSSSPTDCSPTGRPIHNSRVS